MTTQAKHYTRHIVRSVWGENDENKGTAAWYAHNLQDAREQHELNFPNEKIIEIVECDADHFESLFDALSSW